MVIDIISEWNIFGFGFYDFSVTVSKGVGRKISRGPTEKKIEK